MRIVHVANANYKYLGLRNYGLPIKINNGFIRNGHDVYFFSERDIARASSLFGNRKMGVKACNKKLLQVCKNFEPEVLALAHADLIYNETIEAIRQFLPDLLVFQYNIDALFIPSNVEHIKSKIDFVDHTFMTTAGMSLRSVAGKYSGVSYIPNPVDSSIDACKNHEKDILKTDIIFAAAMNRWVAEDDLRAQAPGAIKKSLPQLQCEFYGNDNKIWGAEFRKAICRSRMGLNFSLRPAGLAAGTNSPLYLYSSDRISLYMGNGLLTFVTVESQLSDLYGEGVVAVQDITDLIDRLSYYNANDSERKRVAKIGYDFSHQHCNERLVAQYMLEQASGQKLSHDYVWPTTVYTCS